jgi:hypothetical protein
MKTRSDLIVATLKKLNAIAAGQNPAPEDVQEIEDIIDGILDELESIEVIVLADRQQFEDQVIDPLAVILANAAAPAFGQASDDSRKMASQARLRALKPSTYVSGTAVEAEYF